MRGRCVIVGSVRQEGLNGLNNIIKNGDYVICADGGSDICLAEGIMPDLYIGDTDSSVDIADTEKIFLPAEKDLTDLQAAINAGLDKGFYEFILTGCTGKRFDHHYAAVCMLEYLFIKGCEGKIIDAYNIIFYHNGGIKKFKKLPEYKYISVLPIDERLTGVTLTGMKYPLNKATLLRTETVGVSNEFIMEEAEILIESGRALVVYSRD